MRTSLALTLCLFAACAETEYRGAHVGGRSVQKELCPTGCNPDIANTLASWTQWERLDDLVFVSEEAGLYDDPCAQLPAEGLCAYACDPVELAKHIEPGSCVTMRCELRDGREILAGGCATAEP
jgi:hypothetical protein